MWVKFTTVQITPDPLFYTRTHSLPRFLDKKLVRCDISIHKAIIGEEISVKLFDEQGREIVEGTLSYNSSDSIFLTNDAAYIQAKTNLTTTSACVELDLFVEECGEE